MKQNRFASVQVLRMLMLACLASLLFCLPGSSRYQALSDMKPSEISVWLKSLSDQPWPQRLESVTARALNTPYFLGPLGEGPKAPFDKKPLIDLTRVDCVTFCEQSLALALAPNYEQAFVLLQKLRYKNGEIKMETRNHYFMADWVPNNRWLVKDVTAEIPGHLWLTRTISHQQLFASQNFTGIQVREPDRTLKQAYIPSAQLLQIQKHLKPGDIGVLIQNLDGIFAAHTGFMFQTTEGRWIYRNATSIGPKKVVDTPYETLVDSLNKSQRLIGMAFVRPVAP